MGNSQSLTHQRCQEEEECFKKLFREYFGSMCVFAGRYLEDGERARDVVHDVFCEVWEKFSSLRGVSNVKNYLYTMVRNRCLDILRRESVHQGYSVFYLSEPKESDDFFEMETLREDLYRLLDEAILLLPERSREVLLLKLQGLKNQEISDALGVSVNTVNTLKTNAYKVLREQLQDKYLRCLLFFVFKVN